MLPSVPYSQPGSEFHYHHLFEMIPEKVSIARPNGRLETVNQLWLDYLGLTQRELHDSNWHEFVHPDDLSVTLEAWQRAVLSGLPVDFERRIRRSDGSYRWHLSRLRAVHNGSRPPQMWIGIDTDIDDQKMAARRLEAAARKGTDELKEFVIQLETFSYTMAHDLRGPLRTMQGYAQILAEDYGATLDPTARSYLAMIGSAAGRMHRLVTDILIYTRVTSEPPAMTFVPLTPLFEALRLESPLLQTALIIDGVLPTVWGDPSALSQAFGNLLSNAVKFVEAGRIPIIHISAVDEGDRFAIAVSDNGIGIPACDHERVFKMFERTVASRNFEGAGIGLAIVRKSIERMGGTVSLESNAELGSTFQVRLRHNPIQLS